MILLMILSIISSRCRVRAWPGTGSEEERQRIMRAPRPALGGWRCSRSSPSGLAEAAGDWATMVYPTKQKGWPTGQSASGTVKWYNPEKAYGFITVESGENIFVHRSAIADGRDWLVDGQVVSLIVRQGVKGPEAAEVRVVQNVADAPPWREAAYRRGKRWRTPPAARAVSRRCAKRTGCGNRAAHRPGWPLSVRPARGGGTGRLCPPRGDRSGRREPAGGRSC